MDVPSLSAHFQTRQPSAIRLAQILFAKRTDKVTAINVAIGNVSLPMHPAMVERMENLSAPTSPFRDGVVKYTPTVGLEEANRAFLNIIASSGFSTDGLHCHITDGGSLGMELVTVGLCGPAGSTDHPLLLIDAAYVNYKAFAERVGRDTVSICRTLGNDGKFSLPSLEEIDRVMTDRRPGAMVVIPYDNPTGHFCDRETMCALARLCVQHDMWMVSDEAYRELHYTGEPPVSIWGLSDKDAPGIQGRRISIETASKVWNACGLRIGALVTDSAEFHQRAVAEATASLSASHIGQYIFGALANVSHAALQQWYARQRDYYRRMMQSFTQSLREKVPGIIVSSPDASIYSVVDVRQLVGPEFDALDFVLFCTREGRVAVGGEPYTVLTAPMAGFYSLPPSAANPGRTQMRIAYVEPPEKMALVPELLARLLEVYLGRASA